MLWIKGKGAGSSHLCLIILEIFLLRSVRKGQERDIREGKKERDEVWKKTNEVNRDRNMLLPVPLEDLPVI